VAKQRINDENQSHLLCHRDCWTGGCLLFCEIKGAQMKSEQEIKEVKAQLEKLSGFIADLGNDEEFGHKDVAYSNDIDDALSWVLGQITTERFLSDAYVNLSNLYEIAEKVEVRTGNKVEDYE
jgi:hypothetical protein